MEHMEEGVTTPSDFSITRTQVCRDGMKYCGELHIIKQRASVLILMTGHIFSLSHWLLFTDSNLPGLLGLDGDFFFIRSIEGEDDKATLAQAALLSLITVF